MSLILSTLCLCLGHDGALVLHAGGTTTLLLDGLSIGTKDDRLRLLGHLGGVLLGTAALLGTDLHALLGDELESVSGLETFDEVGGCIAAEVIVPEGDEPAGNIDALDSVGLGVKPGFVREDRSHTFNDKLFSWRCEEREETYLVFFHSIGQVVDHGLIGCLGCFELGSAGDLIYLAVVNDLVVVVHDLILPLSILTLHRLVQLVALLLGREKFEESLGKFRVNGAEQVVEVFLVDRELRDVEVQVPEGGVTHGGPTFAAELDLLCIPGELFAEGLGVADDVGREPIDGAGGGEELDVEGGPFLRVLWNKLHECCLVLTC